MFTNLAQEEENLVNTYMYLYSMNSLINYVYEFGSGRGKFSKSPVISLYTTAFCELSIAVMVSLSSKLHPCSLILRSGVVVCGP